MRIDTPTVLVGPFWAKQLTRLPCSFLDLPCGLTL